MASNVLFSFIIKKAYGNYVKLLYVRVLHSRITFRALNKLSISIGSNKLFYSNTY